MNCMNVELQTYKTSRTMVIIKIQNRRKQWNADDKITTRFKSTNTYNVYLYIGKNYYSIDEIHVYFKITHTVIIGVTV